MLKGVPSVLEGYTSIFFVVYYIQYMKYLGYTVTPQKPPTQPALNSKSPFLEGLPEVVAEQALAEYHKDEQAEEQHHQPHCPESIQHLKKCHHGMPFKTVFY